jgi:hypothetical protein
MTGPGIKIRDSPDPVVNILGSFPPLIENPQHFCHCVFSASGPGLMSHETASVARNVTRMHEHVLISDAKYPISQDEKCQRAALVLEDLFL